MKKSNENKGVVRHVDDLGRIVTPKEFRRRLGIKDGDEVEVFLEDDCMVIKKYYPEKSILEQLETIKSHVAEAYEGEKMDCMMKHLDMVTILLKGE